MHVVLELLSLVAIVGFGSAFSRRLGVSEPLALVALGIGFSYIPSFLDITLNPGVVLFGLLPPLLYAAAIRTSLIDFKANRQPVLLLAIGLVIVTTVSIGFLSWWVVPGVSLAAAFALGGVVAPPDAVAATTIARRVGIPRRVVSILEGEGLVNDATSLVAVNTAIAAMTGTVSPWHVGWDFVRAAGGGLIIGWVAAGVLLLVRRFIEDPVLDTTLSFAAPYVAFLPAEELHCSGVLSVVVCGLLLGHSAPRVQSARSRIAENLNWRTVQFLLENVVFILIGLQIRFIIEAEDVTHPHWWHVVGYCGVVLAACVIVRLLYVFASALVHRLFSPESAWSWQVSAVVGWAGMRGVVTLAAVFLLPLATPQRPLLVLIAFVVVAGTLLLQGLTLPTLVRWLKLPAPDAAEDALQSASLVTEAARAGLDLLEQITAPSDPPHILEELRERAMRRSNRIWEQLGRPQSEIEPPLAAYRRLRLEMLGAERAAILAARDRGVYDDEVLRAALSEVDLEESMLDRVEDAAARIDDELLTSPALAGDCEHLRETPRVAKPRTPGVCEECQRDGTTWVHLRLCLTCGHVGCCDSSIGKHASAHFHEKRHPVMRSAEPGEAWRWCYVDDLLG